MLPVGSEILHLQEVFPGLLPSSGLAGPCHGCRTCNKGREESLGLERLPDPHMDSGVGMGKVGGVWGVLCDQDGQGRL
jgi:hypothetical protein